MPTAGGGPTRIWQAQLPVDYLDASLTINVWETVEADLSEGDPARLRFIVIEQTNNGAAVENLELEITINGTAYTWTIVNAASGTPYACVIGPSLVAGDFETLNSATIRHVGEAFYGADIANPFNARTVGLIRVRQTTAVDAVAAQIEVNIVWDRLLTV